MIKKLKKIFFLMLVVVTRFSLAQDTIKQPLYVGVSFEALMSTSGHGGYYAGYLTFHKKRSTLKFGAMMQKRNDKINGARFAYSYRLVSFNGEDIFNMSFSELKAGTFQLNIVPFLMYEDQAGLSYKRSREEGIFSSDSSINWNQVNISTFEGGVSLEFSLKPCRGVLLSAYLGVSIFSHINYLPGMYYEKTSAALIMGAGLSFPGIRFGGKKRH